LLPPFLYFLLLSRQIILSIPFILVGSPLFFSVFLSLVFVSLRVEAVLFAEPLVFLVDERHPGLEGGPPPFLIGNGIIEDPFGLLEQRPHAIGEMAPALGLRLVGYARRIRVEKSVMRALRVYADTSVFGGVFDAEFALSSRAFFEQVRQGRFQLISSALVRDELREAPKKVRDLFGRMVDWMEISEIGEDGVDLQIAYLAAGIVGEGSMADALHVAMATVLDCRMIVSWNFRHIVHFEKIPLYNAVNTTHGYAEIAIHAPQEVVAYEEEGL